MIEDMEKAEKAIQEARVSEESSQQVTPDRAQGEENSNKSSSANLFKNGLSPIENASPKPFEADEVGETPKF